MLTTPDWVWMNGELVPWKQATIHVMAHGLHYGSTTFEGIRSYRTEDGSAIFRLQDHIQRLMDSCKMYRINPPYSSTEIETACVDVVVKNELADAYIRPIIYRDVFNLGLCPVVDDPVGMAVLAFEWGPLHGASAASEGCDVCVSSWKRNRSDSIPVLAKAGGHYLTSQLISMEAKQNGYDEGIAIDSNGNLTEGSGVNVFAIRRGKLLTPPLSSAILEGITRDTIIKIAGKLEIDCLECEIPRESLYIADELFMVGTAAEVTPIRSLDRIAIGSGKPGPVTRQFQQEYRSVVTGKNSLGNDWLTYTSTKPPAKSQSNPAVTS